MEMREELQRTLGHACTLDRAWGGGGSLQVCRAEEKALDRKVAIKGVPR
jgi:hypothetical protein